MHQLTEAPSGMRTAARELASSLSPEQLATATFAYDDPERLDWGYVPRERHGLPLADMDPSQRDRTARLLREALSERAARQVDEIRVLEGILREREGDWRDPELYFVTLFGDVAGDGPWGWRFEGHHVSLNFASTGGGLVASTPSFLGSNPARVAGGAHGGLRVLGAEEDLGYALLASLDDARRSRAVLSGAPPADILLVPGRWENVEAAGLPLAELDEAQRAAFWRLVEVHLDRLRGPLAAGERARLRALDPAQLLFVWIGSAEPGEPHYYRVRGPQFAIELDNGLAGAGHVHTVWRDLERDFGRDLLREHLEREHGGR